MALMLSLLIILMPSYITGAQTIVSSCTVIFQPGSYLLSRSIMNSTSTACISITSGNVILDGAGFTIDGLDRWDAIGVNVYNSTTALMNVTIRNLNVTDWDVAINYINASNGNITDNNASSNRAGIVLELSSGNNLTGNSATTNGAGIVLEFSGGNDLAGNDASSNDNYGIFLSSSGSNSLTGNNASNNNIGIILSSSGSNNLTGNSASNNNMGIRLQFSGSNNLTGNSASNNAEGISLSHSGSNHLASNYARSNNIGILQYSSSGSSLSGNYAFNNIAGILLFSSSHNSLNGNHALHNNIGIDLRSSSENNMASGNNVDSNKEYGISLLDSGNNTFYYTFFNNSQNFRIDNSINRWNITESGTTGDFHQVGNFWGNPNGTGFSQTCEDGEGDAICDLSYKLDSNNIDHMPLAHRPDIIDKEVILAAIPSNPEETRDLSNTDSHHDENHESPTIPSEPIIASAAEKFSNFTHIPQTLALSASCGIQYY